MPKLDNLASHGVNGTGAVYLTVFPVGFIVRDFYQEENLKLGNDD